MYRNFIFYILYFFFMIMFYFKSLFILNIVVTAVSTFFLLIPSSLCHSTNWFSSSYESSSFMIYLLIYIRYLKLWILGCKLVGFVVFTVVFLKRVYRFILANIYLWIFRRDKCILEWCLARVNLTLPVRHETSKVSTVCFMHSATSL